MSKIVVVLIPGRASEFLTVDDGETSVTWALVGIEGGATSSSMPIESYWCEGEEFYFVRVENIAGDELTTSTLH